MHHLIGGPCAAIVSELGAGPDFMLDEQGTIPCWVVRHAGSGSDQQLPDSPAEGKSLYSGETFPYTAVKCIHNLPLYSGDMHPSAILKLTCYCCS
jgi:hypothetical protein